MLICLFIFKTRELTVNNEKNVGLRENIYFFLLNNNFFIPEYSRNKTICYFKMVVCRGGLARAAGRRLLLGPLNVIEAIYKYRRCRIF